MIAVKATSGDSFGIPLEIRQSCCVPLDAPIGQLMTKVKPRNRTRLPFSGGVKGRELHGLSVEQGVLDLRIDDHLAKPPALLEAPGLEKHVRPGMSREQDVGLASCEVLGDEVVALGLGFCDAVVAEADVCHWD